MLSTSLANRQVIITGASKSAPIRRKARRACARSRPGSLAQSASSALDTAAATAKKALAIIAVTARYPSLAGGKMAEARIGITKIGARTASAATWSQPTERRTRVIQNRRGRNRKPWIAWANNHMDRTTEIIRESTHKVRIV